jgi:hypothetical protein
VSAHAKPKARVTGAGVGELLSALHRPVVTDGAAVVSWDTGHQLLSPARPAARGCSASFSEPPTMKEPR